MGFKFEDISKSRVWLFSILLGLLITLFAVWDALKYAGKNRNIEKIDIAILPDSGIFFLNEQDIFNIVNRTYGNPQGKQRRRSHSPSLKPRSNLCPTFNHRKYT